MGGKNAQREGENMQMLRYGFVLLIICFFASLTLSVTYKITHSRIEAQAINEERDSLAEVFPGATNFKDAVLDSNSYYIAEKDNKEIGYVIRVQTKGYGGLINMLVGFDINGEIKGVKILSHSETPGLGAKINEVRAGEKVPWFLKQFEGKFAKNLELKDTSEGIQAITGATISSNAVVSGIKKEVTEFISRLKL